MTYSFGSHFVAEAIGDRQWRLTAPLIVMRNGEHWFSVPPGFITDLLSTPPILWPIFDPVNPVWLLPAVAHDYLYWDQCPVKATRKEADDFLRDAGAASGCGYIRWLVWLGVRAFGAPHWSVPLAVPSSIDTIASNP